MMQVTRLELESLLDKNWENRSLDMITWLKVDMMKNIAQYS